jgi:hypothetical protein
MSRRPASRRGLKSWNFWTPILGTVYGVRGYYRGRPRYIYGGKTTQVPWTKRPEDHLWARHWERAPKFWAHTVLGYRPNGTIEEVIAAGGVFIIWQARTVPLVLSLVEVIYAIKIRRPVHNRQWNMNNRRRSRHGDIDALRTRQALVQSGGMAVDTPPRRAGGLRVGLTIASLFGLLMFLPGMPGATAVLGFWELILANRFQLAGWAVLILGTAAVAGRTLAPKRRRSRRRRR